MMALVYFSPAAFAAGPLGQGQPPEEPYALQGWSIIPDEPAPDVSGGEAGEKRELTGPENYAKGEESYDMGDYERALGYYQAALAQLDDVAHLSHVHERLAYIYAAFDEPDKVYDEFVQSLTLDTSLELDPDMVSPKIYDAYFRARDAVVSEGTLVINCEPSGAEVYLDGVLLGDAPVRKGRIKAGEYKLTLKKPGFETSSGTINIKKNVTLTVDDKMAEATGSLEISSRPPGASVVLDGRQAGVTPVKVDKVSGGEHKLVFKRDYYEPREASVTTSTGEQASCRGVLKRRVLLIGADTGKDGSGMVADALTGTGEVMVLTAGLDGLGDAMKKRGLDPASLGFLAARKKVLSLEDAAALSGIMEDARAELALLVTTGNSEGGTSLDLALFSTASDMVDTVDLAASDMDGLRREAEKFAEGWRATTGTLRPCIGARLVDRAIGGVEVIDVVPGLPAAKAGILPGDLITGVDGSPVAAKPELDRAVAIGGTHRLTLSRRGTETGVQVGTLSCPVETPVGAGGYLYNLKLVDAAGYLENVPAVEGVADDERGIAALDLGNVYMRLGEYGKAVESYSEVNMASKAGICTGTALYRMGEAYEKLGRWTEAAYAFRQAMLLYPDATLTGAEGLKAAPLAKERLMKLFDAGLVMDRWWL